MCNNKLRADEMKEEPEDLTEKQRTRLRLKVFNNYLSSKLHKQIPRRKFGRTCPLEYWEVIVVDHDEEFDNRRTIRTHCDLCGKDFEIFDFETGEVLRE